jgi:hypothetical protein
MRKYRSILEKLTRLETLLIVQDPKGPLSADAYDGLRKSVVHATQARRHHISHLISLRDSLERNASQELLSDRVSEFLNELGVSWIDDPKHAELFVREGNPKDGEPGEWVCTRPAVVSQAETGELMLHRQGTAIWNRLDASDPAQRQEVVASSPEDAEGATGEEQDVNESSDEEGTV